jgi:hypothetical protein
MTVETGNQALIGQVVDRLRNEFGPDPIGVLVGGSRVTGDARPSSDLDVIVLIARSQRQRRNVVIAGTEVEMFIDPPAEIRRYLEEGYANGRGQIAHMCASGRVVFDQQGQMAELQSEARAIVEAGPPALSEQECWQFRYAVADALRDIDDVKEDDPARTLLLIGLLVAQLIDQHYRIARRWLQKRKRVLQDLVVWDQAAARLAHDALSETQPVGDRCIAVRVLAEHVLAPLGGIMPVEWRTAWEEIEPGSAAPMASDLLPGFLPPINGSQVG